MSEVNIAKRKEKCENCTKQVGFVLSQLILLYKCWDWKTMCWSEVLIFLTQCNKKQSEDGANSNQEGEEVNGQVVSAYLENCIADWFERQVVGLGAVV